MPLFWGGARGRGRGVSSWAWRLEGPRELAPSCGIGFEICRGALMVGRPFLFPPLLRDILDLSSDIAARSSSARTAHGNKRHSKSLKNAETQESGRQGQTVVALSW